MPNSQRQWRVLGTASFVLAAAAPLGALAIYLFAVTPQLWQQSLSYAYSNENQYRAFFVVLAAAGVFSAIAVGIIAVVRRKAVLRTILALSIAQVAAYAVFEAWFLTFIAALSVWCAFMVQHEV
jgi:hypothetical protein